MGAFLVIQALLLTLNYLSSPLGPDALRDKHWRNVDSQGIADALAGPARAALGGPVRVIVGPPAPAGAIALRLPERPLVLIVGRADRSPWISPGAAGRVRRRRTRRDLGTARRYRGGAGARRLVLARAAAHGPCHSLPDRRRSVTRPRSDLFKG